MPPLHYDFEQVCTGQILNNPTQFNNCYFCALLKNIRSSHRDQSLALMKGCFKCWLAIHRSQTEQWWMQCMKTITNIPIISSILNCWHLYQQMKNKISLLSGVAFDWQVVQVVVGVLPVRRDVWWTRDDRLRWPKARQQSIRCWSALSGVGQTIY